MNQLQRSKFKVIWAYILMILGFMFLICKYLFDITLEFLEPLSYSFIIIGALLLMVTGFNVIYNKIDDLEKRIDRITDKERD
jgi:hypothetical protein